jgi:hypothetical protein
MTLENPASGLPISGVIFENHGSQYITVNQLRWQLSDGQIIDEGSFGFGVDAGESITALMDCQTLHTVQSLSFVVQGSTEALTVVTTQQIGVCPGTPTP